MTKRQPPRPLAWRRARVGGFVAMARAGCAALALGFLVAGAAGCAKAAAASAPDGPPLQVPVPPEHVLLPVELPDATAAVPEPEITIPPPAPPRTPAARPAPKPQPTPPAAAPVAAQPAPPAAPPESRELRAPAPAGGVDERGVRELLSRATRDLNRVDYNRLSAERRDQYEQSKRFGAQAEEALKERNLIFAATLADKAATLAAELLSN